MDKQLQQLHKARTKLETELVAAQAELGRVQQVMAVASGRVKSINSQIAGVARAIRYLSPTSAARQVDEKAKVPRQQDTCGVYLPE